MICEFCDEKLACTPMLSVPGPSYQLARLLTATGGKKVFAVNARTLSTVAS